MSRKAALVATNLWKKTFILASYFINQNPNIFPKP